MLRVICRASTSVIFLFRCIPKYFDFFFSNIPIKDPSDVPDPFVILYLLPKRSKETKRKTIVVKNSCDPVYETTFEYGSITPTELRNMELEVTVKTKLTFLSGGSLTIGMVGY